MKPTDIADIQTWLNELENAIKNRDKKLILLFYEDTRWDWDNTPAFTAEKYDTLVDLGNDILYS